MSFINRIRKKALTDEELVAVRHQESANIKAEPEETTRSRLQAIMDEAIPLVEDVQTLDYNLAKLKKQFEPRGYVILGQILSTQTTEAGVLTEYQINVQTRDGIVQLHVVPPNWPAEKTT